MKFGEVVKQMRKSEGITQGDLAKMMGCSIAYISNIEREIAGVSLKQLDKIANLLGKEAKTIIKDK